MSEGPAPSGEKTTRPPSPSRWLAHLVPLLWVLIWHVGPRRWLPPLSDSASPAVVALAFTLLLAPWCLVGVVMALLPAIWNAQRGWRAAMAVMPSVYAAALVDECFLNLRTGEGPRLTVAEAPALLFGLATSALARGVAFYALVWLGIGLQHRVQRWRRSRQQR